MSIILSSLLPALVIRLLREYSDEYGENWNMYFNEDISFLELEEQLLLLDAAYTTKILAVLE